MERPVYLDVDGRERERQEWDKHHVFARTILKGEGEVAWASLSGILLPVYREFHNKGSSALHNNVPLDIDEAQIMRELADEAREVIDVESKEDDGTTDISS